MDATKQKHPCADCGHCQWCADSRCSLCLSTRCSGRKKLSVREQIDLYEQRNRGEQQTGQEQ